MKFYLVRGGGRRKQKETQLMFDENPKPSKSSQNQLTIYPSSPPCFIFILLIFTVKKI